MHPGRLVSFRPLDPANRPRPLKVYPDLEQVLLPGQILRSSTPASEVLSGRQGPPAELGDELLGTLLFLAAGVTRCTAHGDERVWFRTAMSAGNLHPVEIYVVRSGVHHYQPLEHGHPESVSPRYSGVMAQSPDRGEKSSVRRTRGAIRPGVAALEPLGAPEPGIGPDGPPPPDRVHERRIATYGDDDDGGAMVREPRSPKPPRGSMGAHESEPQ